MYDNLKQQLHSLTDQHTSLAAQQHAFAPEDLTKYNSDLAELRSGLAEAKAVACTNADKLAAALETCRYHSCLACFFDHLHCDRGVGVFAVFSSQPSGAQQPVVSQEICDSSAALLHVACSLLIDA